MFFSPNVSAPNNNSSSNNSNSSSSSSSSVMSTSPPTAHHQPPIQTPRSPKRTQINTPKFYTAPLFLSYLLKLPTRPRAYHLRVLVLAVSLTSLPPIPVSNIPVPSLPSVVNVPDVTLAATCPVLSLRSQCTLLLGPRDSILCDVDGRGASAAGRPRG